MADVTQRIQVLVITCHKAINNKNSFGYFEKAVFYKNKKSNDIVEEADI